MRRRALLTSLATGTATLGGCSALTSSADRPAETDRTDSPTTGGPLNDLPMTETLRVETSGPLSPGDSGTVALALAGATQLGFQSIPGAISDEERPVRFEFGRPPARFDPNPDIVFQSLPPGWNWQEPRDVRVLVPFEVSPTADAGRYSFAIGGTREGSDVRATGAVLVE